MRHFRVLTYSEEPELASTSAEVARAEKYEKSSSDATEAVGSRISSGQEAKTEILIEMLVKLGYSTLNGCCKRCQPADCSLRNKCDREFV
jgi:hypothetical protein